MVEKRDNRAALPPAAIVANLRRFLKARWEEGDPRLFTSRTVAGPSAKPMSAASPAPRQANSYQPKAPPAAPVRQPASSYSPKAMAKPSPSSPAFRPPNAYSAKPAISPLADPHSPRPAGKPPARHPSGIQLRANSARGSELVAFYEKIKACEDCPLARTRKSFVFGCGNPEASIMFVGEAPGEQEDKQGLPFVGPAGHLLDRLLEGVGIRRDDVFIANVLKCRPPGNRKPADDEIAACDPHLAGQVKIVAPKFLVALGTFAAQSILRSTRPIGQIRGRWYRIGESDFLATYHPSAGLRAGDFKRVIEADLKLLKEKLDKTRANPGN